MTQTIVNLGTGGAVLNGRNGSTTSADSNDALFLDWTGLNYVYLPGVDGNYLSVPDAAALDITGDIDIRVQVAMDDWTPGVAQHLAARFGINGSADWSWRFAIQAGGFPLFTWSESGTGAFNKSATAASVVTDGSALWLRATLDVNNGASGNDVKFFTSTDGVSWVQLGATVTTAGTTSIFAGSSPVHLGALFAGTGELITGKIYRAQVFNGIDGTKVLDVDTSVITSGAATSFTALTGQTVTINRSTAGRKAVAVVSPVWLFGTDDYMEVADNALLNFGAADSFTVVVVARQWNPDNDKIYVSKRENISQNIGYELSTATASPVNTVIDDGPNGFSAVGGGHLAGALFTRTGVVNRSTQLMRSFLNSTAGTSTSVSAAGALGSTAPFRVGVRVSGYIDAEIIAVAVFRRALTAIEITRITAYYQARLS